VSGLRDLYLRAACRKAWASVAEGEAADHGLCVSALYRVGEAEKEFGASAPDAMRALAAESLTETGRGAWCNEAPDEVFVL
jgi:hypothetical protein